MCQYRELLNCNEDAVYVGFDRHGQSRYLCARKSYYLNERLSISIDTYVVNLIEHSLGVTFDR